MQLPVSRGSVGFTVQRPALAGRLEGCVGRFLPSHPRNLPSPLTPRRLPCPTRPGEHTVSVRSRSFPPAPREGHLGSATRNAFHRQSPEGLPLPRRLSTSLPRPDACSPRGPSRPSRLAVHLPGASSGSLERQRIACRLLQLVTTRGHTREPPVPGWRSSRLLGHLRAARPESRAGGRVRRQEFSLGHQGLAHSPTLARYRLSLGGPLGRSKHRPADYPSSRLPLPRLPRRRRLRKRA